MTAIDGLKLKLSRFFSGKIDRSQLTPSRVFEKGRQFHLTFKRNNNPGEYEIITKSDDGFSFTAVGEKVQPQEKLNDFPKAVKVGNFRWENKGVMFFGDRTINIANSADGKKWQANPRPLLVSASPLELIGVFVRRNSLMVLYYEKIIKNGLPVYSAYLAFFNKKNPSEMIWKTGKPIWRQTEIWPDEKITPLGAVIFREQLIGYWYRENLGVYGVVFSGFEYNPAELDKQKLKLRKHFDNPIISPNPKNSWEAFNTFNPAAILTGGNVHILYRAQGFDYISSVGYAVSKNGYDIEMRSDRPVFKPTMNFENNDHDGVNYDFMSGGGYGGCEDPRITRLGDKIYMTYVAFDGWSPPRLALTSILVSDFLKQRWLWTKPVLISPPGVVDKSGCLLPEKINGKYVFFHRVFPNILIDYVDDLNFNGRSKWLRGQYQIKIRPDKWDSRKIGVGAPPLKTKDGWLLIYYGVDDRDASKYHIGAMLLDLKDPTKVLYRTDKPILYPTEDYENNGFKPGITYPCGAVVLKDKLLVYYGAADSVVCVATAELNNFLDELKSKKQIKLVNLKIKEIQY